MLVLVDVTLWWLVWLQPEEEAAKLTRAGGQPTRSQRLAGGQPTRSQRPEVPLLPAPVSYN